MYVDPKTHTTATLYGDDAAVSARTVSSARSGEGNSAGISRRSRIGAGHVDPARRSSLVRGPIPDAPQSVEFVRIAAARTGR